MRSFFRSNAQHTDLSPFLPQQTSSCREFATMLKGRVLLITKFLEIDDIFFHGALKDYQPFVYRINYLSPFYFRLVNLKIVKQHANNNHNEIKWYLIFIKKYFKSKSCLNSTRFLFHFILFNLITLLIGKSVMER